MGSFLRNSPQCLTLARKPTANDAWNVSSTDAEAPRKWLPIRLATIRREPLGDGHDNRSRYREVGVSGSRRRYGRHRRHSRATSASGISLTLWPRACNCRGSTGFKGRTLQGTRRARSPVYGAEAVAAARRLRPATAIMQRACPQTAAAAVSKEGKRFSIALTRSVGLPMFGKS